MNKVSKPKTFLSAEWRKLVMANYAVDPTSLQPYLPPNTELDTWNGTCYVSLVGFMFCDTKVLGVKIPWHINFEEVNLRFYVRYKAGNEWKRGVVFIKEIVPKAAITLVANTLYNEKYATMPMQHEWREEEDHLSVAYRWKFEGEWNHINVQTALQPVNIAKGSEEEFITEHYWGYTKTGANQTSEYAVEHPVWDVYPVQQYDIHCNASALYGPEFGEAMSSEPVSVLMAEGSPILVRRGIII
ncbi:DUF2071 domain-containing protein [Limibacter armeniacum]|uniref:YqjF family protein n=1 Tax=Limibacter armeniacum TaxID=466084 RepID=UPI002FE5F727